jgi:hypothetical protein
MNNETQHRYLIFADISVYTSYLAGVSQFHARQMIKVPLRPGAS